MGSDQSSLSVVHPAQSVLLCGKPQANIMDYKPMVNIMPFGRCSSLANPTVAAATAANYGRLQKMPCIPNIVAPWMNGKMNVLVKGSPALLDCSKCMCLWAGAIEVADPGQNVCSTGESGAGADLVSSLGDSLQGENNQVNSLTANSNNFTSQNAGATAVGNNLASNSSAAASAGNAVLGKLLIRGVIGKSEVLQGDTVRYEVSGYNRDKSSVSEEEKSRIKWGVMCDGSVEEQNGISGEVIELEMKDKWYGKDISVMACMEGFNMNVCQKTKVKRLLIKEVEGKSDAHPGELVTYRVSAYKDILGNDIDKSLVSDKAKSLIKWAVKADGTIKELVDDNGKKITGEEISLEITDNWLDKDILVMAYVEGFNENVSRRTTVEQTSKNIYDIFLDSHKYIKKNAKTNSNIYLYRIFKTEGGTILAEHSLKQDIKGHLKLLEFPQEGSNWGRYGFRDDGGDNWINEKAAAAFLGFLYNLIEEGISDKVYYDDISGYNGRDLGHSTHRAGDDIDVRYPGTPVGKRYYYDSTYYDTEKRDDKLLVEKLEKVLEIAVKWKFTKNYVYKRGIKNATYASNHEHHFHIGHKE